MRLIEDVCLDLKGLVFSADSVDDESVDCGSMSIFNWSLKLKLWKFVVRLGNMEGNGSETDLLIASF
jgi:hypothetical protein